MVKSENLQVKQRVLSPREALTPTELGYLSFAMKLAEQMIREIKPDLTPEEDGLVTKAKDMIFVDANAGSQQASVRTKNEWNGSREVQSTFTVIVFNKGLFKFDGKVVGVEGATKQVIEAVFLAFQLTLVAFHEMLHILQLAHEKNIAKEIPPASLKMVLQFFLKGRGAFGGLHHRLGYRREHLRAAHIPLLTRTQEQVLFNFANEMSVDGMTEHYCIAGAENITRAICRGMKFDDSLARELAEVIGPIVEKEFIQRAGYTLEKAAGKELSKGIAQFIRSLPEDSDHRISHRMEYMRIRNADEKTAALLVEGAIHQGSITGDYTFLSLIKDVYGSDAYAIFARLPDSVSIQNAPADTLERYRDMILTAYDSGQDTKRRDEALKQLAQMIGVSIS